MEVWILVAALALVLLKRAQANGITLTLPEMPAAVSDLATALEGSIAGATGTGSTPPLGVPQPAPLPTTAGSATYWRPSSSNGWFPKVAYGGARVVFGNGKALVGDFTFDPPREFDRTPEGLAQFYPMGPFSSDEFYALDLESFSLAKIYGVRWDSGVTRVVAQGPSILANGRAGHGHWSTRYQTAIIVDNLPFTPARANTSGWEQDGLACAYADMDNGFVPVIQSLDRSIVRNAPVVGTGFKCYDTTQGPALSYYTVGSDERQIVLGDGRVFKTNCCPNDSACTVVLDRTGRVWLWSWTFEGSLLFPGVHVVGRPLDSDQAIVLNMPGVDLSVAATDEGGWTVAGTDNGALTVARVPAGVPTVTVTKAVFTGLTQPNLAGGTSVPPPAATTPTPPKPATTPKVDPATLAAAVGTIAAHPVPNAAYQACFNSMMIGAPGASVVASRVYDDGLNALLVYGGTTWADVQKSGLDLSRRMIISGVGPDALTFPPEKLAALFGSIEGAAGGGSDNDAVVQAVLGGAAQAASLGKYFILNVDGDWRQMPNVAQAAAAAGNVIPMIECYPFLSAGAWFDEVNWLKGLGFGQFAFAIKAYIQPGNQSDTPKSVAGAFAIYRGSVIGNMTGGVFLEAPFSMLRPGGIIDTGLLPLVAALQASNGPGTLPNPNIPQAPGQPTPPAPPPPPEPPPAPPESSPAPPSDAPPESGEPATRPTGDNAVTPGDDSTTIGDSGNSSRGATNEGQ